jgi:hypothetical protein
MKRTKQYSRGPRREDDRDGGSSGPQQANVNWNEQVQNQPDTAFVPYALTANFAKGALIMHPTMGKGMVVRVVGTRIEVVFSDGMKKLAHAGPPPVPPPAAPKH